MHAMHLYSGSIASSVALRLHPPFARVSTPGLRQHARHIGGSRNARPHSSPVSTSAAADNASVKDFFEPGRDAPSSSSRGSRPRRQNDDDDDASSNDRGLSSWSRGVRGERDGSSDRYDGPSRDRYDGPSRGPPRGRYDGPSRDGDGFSSSRDRYDGGAGGGGYSRDRYGDRGTGSSGRDGYRSSGRGVGRGSGFDRGDRCVGTCAFQAARCGPS